MSGPKYKRVVLKLSGQSLSLHPQGGIDPGAMDLLAGEIAPLCELGVRTAIVIGGGNFLRGRDLADHSAIDPVTADYMGMLATVMNAVALQDTLEANSLPARTLSAIPVRAVCEPFVRRRALRHMDKGRIVILAGGTGSPFFTTDTCAAVRACELGAEALLKGTKVDGVFDSDPVKNPGARHYPRLTYSQVISDKLGVMDMTAVAMCMKNRIPVIVFRVSTPGNLSAAVRGENVGTIICDE